MGDDLDRYLRATDILNWDHPAVREFGEHALASKDPVERAVKLYYKVRDTIAYDPYSPFYERRHYSADFILDRGRGFCVPKAALLCALGRGAGIPSRIGFATVKNHLATEQLIKLMGSNLFVYHGYTEFFLEGKWVKATPAFDADVCRHHNISPMEFTGREDSIFCEYNLDDHRFMEYVEDYGVFEDVPLEEILTAWRETYGDERIDRWMEALERLQGGEDRDFLKEDVVKS